MSFKIYDCFTFNNEVDLLEIRLNILNKYVDYFVIIESKETHSGKKKKINFNLNNYSNFKNKIIYGQIDSFPPKMNSWEKENFQRNYIFDYLGNANENDLILISDLDEIPNLKNIYNVTFEEKILVFQQRLFFYKLNYGEVLANWHGTKGCKKKFLKSPQWIRNLKTYKKYKFYRLDKIFFTQNYESSFKVIENGGWHFSWLGDLNFIKNKLNSFAHTEFNTHDIFNDNNILDSIKNLKPLNPNQNVKLTKLSIDGKFLPDYLIQNFNKYKKLFDVDSIN